MIKGSTVIREPRGLGWQNWAANCKDVIVRNIKIVTILFMVACTVVGSIMIAQHSSSVYGHFVHQHNQAPSTQLNLNSAHQPTSSAARLTASITPPTESNSGSTQPSQSSAASKVQAARVAARSTSVAGKDLTRCDLSAEASAQLTYQTTMASENAYHNSRLTLLGVSGTVSSLLGNTSTSRQVSDENDRHKDAVNDIQDTLERSLNDLHCN